VSPAGQLSVGKYFSEAVGARLAISGWRGNGVGSNGFYYGAATIDGLFNMSSLFAGSNPERFFNASLIAGLGYNQTFGENKRGNFMGRLGLQGKIRLNEAFDLNLEALANGVGDKWNGLDDHNMDTYFSVLVGVSFKFGTGFNFACPDCEKVYYENDECYDEEYVQSLNNKINDLRAEIDNHKCPEPEPCPEVTKVKPGMKSHVLFGLAKTNITVDQEMNIKAIADYLKQYPEAKASVMGYADKGTGNARINAKYAQNRADAVAQALVAEGISESRIKASSKGDTEQPYAEQILNRVAICIVK
jgi:outer membrane protein OmpA-like peptidoglycan-associated protein